MLGKVLLYLGIGFIILGYIKFILLYFKEKNIKSDKNSLDLILKLFDNNSINVINDKNTFFSKYNINRGIVKLSSRSYDKEDNFSLAVALILSCYGNFKSKFLDFVGKMFKEIRVISFSPIIVILTSLFCREITDYKIGIFILIIVLIYQYGFYNINSLIVEKFKNKNKEIISIIEDINKVNTMFFVATLIEVIRFFLMLLS